VPLLKPARTKFVVKPFDRFCERGSDAGNQQGWRKMKNILWLWDKIGEANSQKGLHVNIKALPTSEKK